MGAKKILLFVDELGSGGAQRQIVALARLLKSKGYNVRLVDYWDNTFYDNELTQLGIPFYHANVKGKWNIIKSLHGAVKEFRPDVVVAYMENPSIVACIVKLISRNKFKLIVSERNTTQTINLNCKIRFHLFRIADHVVPNSYSQCDFINSHYKFLKKKVVPITNLIDVNYFTPGTKGSSRVLTRCLIVGRVVEQKNVLRFISAIHKIKDELKDVKIDWYGKPYPQEYFEQCKNLVKEYGLDDVITFYPPHNAIVEEYRSADFFILPSIYEGFPNVLCEAMCCGLPVLAGRVCDNARIMSDGDNGFLFDPFDVDDMSATIKRFIDLGQSEREMMGRRSRELALERFSEKTFIEKYIKLIES